MALRKHDTPLGRKHNTPLGNVKSLSFPNKGKERAQPADIATEGNIDVDLKELYFLIMHFLSTGPCQRTYGQMWNELLEHQLLPRRYHAWYSRSGIPSGDEDDDGRSFPLNYSMLVQRYSFIEKDHLVMLMKQLVLNASLSTRGAQGGNIFNAAAVPTLLGTGSFSLLSGDQSKTKVEVQHPPRYMRWPHMHADQVRGLSLREIGGGFTRHHRAPSTRGACYAIIKPSIMVQKMQNKKIVRGHRFAVYCAILDRSGRFVITGSDDRLVKIWSMETAYCLASCRGHEGDITDLAVNINNTLVASSSNDCIIRVWRLPDGLPISVLRGHTGAVTAIAFCPRPTAGYQLLSSSDDGTCRIWDARSSHFSPRVYVPKPSDSNAGKSNGPSSSTAQQSHRIFCCAFNANGTVFVTGSSDTLARVWSACKFSTDDTEQPIHELDILAGHENDVNYVQFSGCAAVSRIPVSEALKEDSLPKFKNTSYNHDNIVTCSRDGSAIIWVPRSRRSHGKAGRWVRAYHLKVPPPPMPAQPPRGGPRQRILPTPRGVNMIVWSLDNRFVLAAIMDCRICVWNAGDGSLVHSLTGHTESTYVLDVHPFNPRIAMSAGYDGKTIVWDIWEGRPIRIYEIGHFKLVDGKFSPVDSLRIDRPHKFVVEYIVGSTLQMPAVYFVFTGMWNNSHSGTDSDGTSIILSDDVGQLYILNTGEGELQKDSKYDQFFLGDYRPLIQDTHGNVLDQETQLVPYRRNMQDLLCDAGMIPYPEPYQSMYQQRRLGALGIEWHPPSVRFAVGTDITLDQEYQMLPIADLDMLMEPLPEFTDVINWEPELEIHNDDNDSEYNVTEEESTGEEQGSLGSHSSGESESSGKDNEADDTHEDRLRRSRRRKKNSEVEIMTLSGRRVKRKNLDECDGSSLGNSHGRKSTRKGSKKSSQSSKSLRPQRAAARNALNLFSRINGTSKDGEDDNSVGESSESESTLQGSDVMSEESESSMQLEQYQDHLKGKEICVAEDSVASDKAHELPKIQTDAGSSRRLVLKLSKHPQNSLLKFHDRSGQEGTSAAVPNVGETIENHSSNRAYSNLDALGGCKDGKICWGGAKARTSKRMRTVEHSSSVAYAGSSSVCDGQGRTENSANGHAKSVDCVALQPSSGIQDQESGLHELDNTSEHGKTLYLRGENQEIDSAHSDPRDSSAKINGGIDGLSVHSGYNNNKLDDNQSLEENFNSAPTKLTTKSNILSSIEGPAAEPKFSLDGARQDQCNTIPEIVDTLKDLTFESPKDKVIDASHSDTAGCDRLQSLDTSAGNMPPEVLRRSEALHSNDRMFSAVYRRLKTRNGRNVAEGGSGSTELNISVPNKLNVNEGPETTGEGIRRTRSIRVRSSTRNSSDTPVTISEGTSDTKRDSTSRNGKVSPEQGLETRSAVGLRSMRSRRGNYNVHENSPPDRKRSSHLILSSWLMLSAHEEGSRYIPQLGDEVAYLRQGHQEYIDVSGLRDAGPWRTIKGHVRAVEFCRVSSVEYSTISGSGESGCKLILEFIDPTSEVLGKLFKLTLPELADFPDFLVLKSRYDASIERNWTTRDKCQVWWKNEGEEDGSWWEGRIVGVMVKSPEFPDSPWERYSVSYRTAPKEIHQHSPWELYDASNMHWEPPHLDDEIRDKLLGMLARLEGSGNKAQDHYGIGKLKDVSEKISFINSYPVPLSLDVIQTRLENNYYRSLEAVKHDIEVLVTNAQAYFSKNAEYSKKTKRLTDWFSQTFKSL